MFSQNSQHVITPWKSLVAVGVIILCIVLLRWASIEKDTAQKVAALPWQGTLQWSSTHNMTSKENALHHFEKHGKEFDFHNEMVYVQAANDFVTKPPEGTLSVKQIDGDQVFYHPQKNWFAVVSYKGQIRTFYRLDPEIHGYKSNTDYFNAQAKRQ